METRQPLLLKRLVIILAAAWLLACAALVFILNTVTGQSVARLVAAPLVPPSGNITWFVTRSSGLTAYLLLWISTLWGLAVSSKMFDPFLERLFNFDLHEFLSLLALAFTGVHVIVLLWDEYAPFSVSGILVPFLADYRPIWTGLGIIGLYLTALVTVTFYIRRLIGYAAFRVIHYLSYAAFALVLLHGVFAGTDSPLGTTRLLYLVTGLSVVFLSTYHVVYASLSRPRAPAGAGSARVR